MAPGVALPDFIAPAIAGARIRGLALIWKMRFIRLDVIIVQIFLAALRA